MSTDAHTETIAQTRRRLDIPHDCPTPDEIAERSDQVAPLPPQRPDVEEIDTATSGPQEWLRARATREEISARLALHVATVDGMLAPIIDQVDASAAEQLASLRAWILKDATAFLEDVFQRPYNPGLDAARGREANRRPAGGATERGKGPSP